MIQAPIIGAFYHTANFYAIKLLIDGFTDSENLKYSILIFPIALYVSSVLILEVIWRVRHYAFMKSMPFVRAEIFAKSYDYVQHHSYKFFQNTPSGSLTSKIKGLNSGYNDLWNGVSSAIASPLLMTLVSIASLYFINIQVFIFISIWACIFFPIMTKMSLKIGRLSEITSNAEHKLIGLIADNISNIFSILSFASRSRELSKIKDYSYKSVASKDYKEIKYEIKTAIVGGVLYAIMLFSLLFYMIHLRQIGSISIGDFVYVMTTAFMVVEAIWRLSWDVGQFSKNVGDLKSAFEIIKTPQEKIDKPNAEEIKITKGEIVFKDIYFNYENNKNVFEGFNLQIKAGEKVGLVGYSGSGKSTLISILLKNFKTLSGDCLIDGQSIYDFSSDSLRSQIAVIPQDIMLFHRSIGENIAYAKPNASKEEIERAAYLANIHEFIESLPEKYNTFVGERGVKLSGGQRQRVGVARAILKNAKILVLDEATSSLDSESEQFIQNSINNLLDENITVIAIAHRLATLKHMDRIIVLEKGKITEEGRHDALLLNKNSLYKKLWEGQKI